MNIYETKNTNIGKWGLSNEYKSMSEQFVNLQKTFLREADLDEEMSLGILVW